MRGMLDQDQILSPSLLKSATWVLTLLLVVFGALMLLQSLWMVLTKFAILSALKTAAIGVGGPLAVWLVVRQLGELLMAQHRLNDRLTVLSETLRENREPQSATAEPAPMEATAAPPEPAGFETPAADKPAKPKRRTKSAAKDDGEPNAAQPESKDD